MPQTDFDVIVVGAGASGLTAAAELARAGLRVCCLEARDRIGGRILTVHDPLSPVPVELGAEFVHGRPPEIWDLIASAPLAAYETGGRRLRFENGKPAPHDISEPVDQVMSGMHNAAAQGPDMTFRAFLERSNYSAAQMESSTMFVEGFNAARADVIGIAALARDAEASDRIEGDRSFRILNGYDAVPLALLRHGGDAVSLRLSSMVETIEWQPGRVTVGVRSQLGGGRGSLRCQRAIITVPLGVLQAASGARGAIRFVPEPDTHFAAIRALRFGQAVRVTLRFDRSFWEDSPDLKRGGFVLSGEPVFPTWWTPLPVEAPVITGWTAGPKADSLLGRGEADLVAAALGSFERITRLNPARLEKAYFHDWHADPFARGAYSYVPAGALAAHDSLAQPVAETLYFAGEATDVGGHGGTVHGAIASGRRAARQVIAAS